MDPPARHNVRTTKFSVRRRTEKNRNNENDNNKGSNGASGSRILRSTLAFCIAFSIGSSRSLFGSTSISLSSFDVGGGSSSSSLLDGIDFSLSPWGFPQSTILSSVSTADTTKTTTTTTDDALSNDMKEKEPILRMLEHAGIGNLTEKEIAGIPKWSSVERLYGTGPRIVGLEKCEKYRSRVSDPMKRFPVVAGSFNTGTNFLYQLLDANCYMPGLKLKPNPSLATGVWWQVPWGKHNPLTPSIDTYTRTGKNAKVERYDDLQGLPIVMVRDPYFWMASMCRRSYAAKFPHRVHHCPGLIADKTDEDILKSFQGVPIVENQTMPVFVKYRDHPVPYESLADLWNQYYGLYAQETRFEHIMVRMEDLTFHGPETVKKVCECAGGTIRNNGTFVYLTSSSKENHYGKKDQATGLLAGMKSAGNATKRYDGYQIPDLMYANSTLDLALIQNLNYRPWF